MPPSTGQAGPDGRDKNYIILFDSTGQHSDPLPNGAPVIVRNANGWANQGSGWIGPDDTQTNVIRPGNSFKGYSVYKLEFGVVDISIATLQMRVLADDYVYVELNSPANRVLNGSGNMFTSPTTVTLNRANGLRSGINTLTFYLSNDTGGPTGLNVIFAGTLGDAPAPAPSSNTKVSKYSVLSLNDPVDSASGQFFDTFTDLSLGGPMNLTFSRYYSSALYRTGFSSTLGTNWMSNFDLKANISGSTAQIALFEGELVTFTSAGAQWVLQSPVAKGYQFAQSGTTYRLMDPSTRWIYTFTAAGALTRIEDRNGNALTITQGPSGPTSVSDGLGRTITFTYTNGQLTRVADQAGRAITYAYTGGLLTSMTDGPKRTTTYSYTTAGGIAGLLASTQLPGGNKPVTQTYDSSGRVTSQTDSNGRLTRIAYDGNGGTTITDPLGAITRHLNTANGDISSLSDPGGASASFTMDATNRRTSITDREGNLSRFLYHAPTGYVASATDPLGNTTNNNYTAQTQTPFTFYNLASTQFPDGATETRTYDNSGNLLSITGPDSAQKRFSYDNKGRLISITAPDGGVTTLSWNDDFTLASETDPGGSVRTFSYDASKQLVRMADPAGATTHTYTEAPDGTRSLAIKPPASGSQVSSININGLPSESTSGTGGTFRYAYTNNEQLLSVTDPLGKPTTYTYDVTDQVLTTTDGAGVLSTFAYDTNGNRRSIADASGNTTAFTFTPENRIASFTTPLGARTLLAYDKNGRNTQITLPSGRKFTMTYNSSGFLTRIANPMGEERTLTRNAMGHITQMTFPGAISTTMTRNWRGQFTSVTSANGNKWLYDFNLTGRRSKITDPLGNATSFSYTANQLTSVALPLGTLTITNDAEGRPLRQQYSDGTTITSTYDASGLLLTTDKTTLQRNAAGYISSSNGIGVTYDGANQIATLTYATGKVLTYAYDSNGLLSSISDWVGGRTTFTYDKSSRLIAITYPNGLANTYAYDDDDRLIKLSYGNLGSITLTRDAADRITSADRALPRLPAVTRTSTQQFTYDAAGQLTSATSDKMGRVTSLAGRTYTWNLATQLTGFEDSIEKVSFTYDGLGSINTLSSGPTQNTFVFNYATDLSSLAIVRQGQTDVRYYVYTPEGNLLYSIEASGARRFYHFDEMGNTVLLTNDNGVAVDTYTITPYGEVADHFGASDNPFTFQGQVGVIQTGANLFHIRARHYDATTARFLSRDEIVNTQPTSSEPYAYANGNPLLYVDPLGDADCGWNPFCHVGEAIKNAGNAVVGIFKPKPKPKPTPAPKPKQQPIRAPAPLPTPPLRLPTLAPLIPPPIGIKPVSIALAKLKTNERGELVDLQGNRVSFVMTATGGKLIGNDGSTLIGNDGSTIMVNGKFYLIGNDGSTLIGNDGSTMIPVPSLASLIGNDGASMVAKLIGNDGSTLKPGAFTGFTPFVPFRPN